MRFFPQKHFTHKARVLLPQALVEAATATATAAAAATEAEEGAMRQTRFQQRQRLEQRLWTSLCGRNWDAFDEVCGDFGRGSLPHDEVSYSLMAHGHLLSHRHVSSNALLVLEEMKAADMHPAVVALNERLILSHLEFVNAGIRPNSFAWQNLARLAWMSAARLRNARARRVKTRLQALPAEAVIDCITETHVQAMIAEEHVHAAQIVANDYDLLEQLEAGDSSANDLHLIAELYHQH